MLHIGGGCRRLSLEFAVYVQSLGTDLKSDMLGGILSHKRINLVSWVEALSAQTSVKSVKRKLKSAF